MSYDSLCEKLHPNRITGSSDKMYWIISTILGADWITRDGSYGHFVILSDGIVVDNDFIVAPADEFDRNIMGYIEVAELTEPERKHFGKLYTRSVADHRIVPSWRFDVLETTVK